MSCAGCCGQCQFPSGGLSSGSNRLLVQCLFSFCLLCSFSHLRPALHLQVQWNVVHREDHSQQVHSKGVVQFFYFFYFFSGVTISILVTRRFPFNRLFSQRNQWKTSPPLAPDLSFFQRVPLQTAPPAHTANKCSPLCLKGEKGSPFHNGVILFIPGHGTIVESRKKSSFAPLQCVEISCCRSVCEPVAEGGHLQGRQDEGISVRTFTQANFVWTNFGPDELNLPPVHCGTGIYNRWHQPRHPGCPPCPRATAGYRPQPSDVS